MSAAPSPAPVTDAARRLLVVADSDSYVKWGAALASRLPEGWGAELVVLDTPVRPSDRQLGAALAGTRFEPDDARVLHLDDLARKVERSAPDAVLLSMRGPLVRVAAPLLAVVPHRPVLLSGFPGLTIPAALKAVVYRELTDLIVLHSRREVRDFTANARALGVEVRLGLATLPFLERVRRGADLAHPAEAAVRRDIVFAVQAKVPAGREDRVHLVSRLIETARAQPERRVVVKVRARAGEAQTHEEDVDLAGLLADPEVLRAAGGGLPANLLVADGPMAAHLAKAAALVTISSTAALEAIAAEVPVLLVDDYGVSPAMINTVFEGSGLLAPSAELVAGAYRHPDPGWLGDNYFHGADVDDWIRQLEELVTDRDTDRLRPPERRFDLAGGALRRAFERKRMLGPLDRSPLGAVAVATAVPARWVVRRARWVRRLVRADGRSPYLRPVRGS